MTNMEKYRNAFAEAFEAEPDSVDTFVFRKTEAWDSIAHMSLVAALEDAFSIELEPEEIMAITSFQSGMDVIRGKGIVL